MLQKFSKFLLILIIIILNLNLCYSQAEEGEKLKGTLISSNEEVESIEEVFSDDFSTEFKSSLPTGGWLGFALEKEYQITKIGFAQKSSNSPYILGLFEGANNSTFMDAVPLFLITEEAKIGEMNYIQISVTKKFKYIRYIGPNKSGSVLAGFEIYGIEGKAEEEEVEKEEKFYQPTGIPLVVIHTEDSQEPPSDKEQIDCNIYIINENKLNVYSAGTVKRRGNSTGRLEKGSYRIKFDKKENVLDLSAKARKWALLANHMDHTLLRNLVAFKVSSIMGLKFTPECRSIDLIFNGEYKGNYIICDQIEVHKKRVELAEMDETCVEEPEISGGYMLEMGGGGWGGGSSVFKSNQGLRYTIEYPDEDDIIEEQKNYIVDKINSVEDEVYEEIYDNIDLDSFLKVFLTQEFCANIDCDHGNYFVTKDREDDKLYFGPVWDFDLALDNDRRLFPTNEKEKYAYKYGDSAGTLRDFIIKILSNEKNLEEMKKKWEEITQDGSITTEIVNFINKQSELIKDSQKLNFMRWNILNGRVMFENQGRGSFEAEVDVLREYIEGRVESLGKIIDNSTVTNMGEGIESRHGGGWGDWGRNNNTNRTNQGGWGGWTRDETNN